MNLVLNLRHFRKPLLRDYTVMVHFFIVIILKEKKTFFYLTLYSIVLLPVRQDCIIKYYRQGEAGFIWHVITICHIDMLPLSMIASILPAIGSQCTMFYEQINKVKVHHIHMTPCYRPLFTSSPQEAKATLKICNFFKYFQLYYLLYYLLTWAINRQCLYVHAKYFE